MAKSERNDVRVVEPPAAARDLYETDYVLWLERQARGLRALATQVAAVREFVDVDHLAEEIEDLGRSERNAVRDHARTIIEHLIKLECSPAKSPRSGWRRTVIVHRAGLHDRLTATLEADLRDVLPRLTNEALRAAHAGMSADAGSLDVPKETYALGNILDSNWWPKNHFNLADKE